MSNRFPHKHLQRFVPPLNALKAFESAARLKSLTKAAEELSVTRAAVSQQVKQLEQYLNAALFERVGSKLVLTAEAEYYLPLLTQLFDSLSVGTEQLFERKRRHLVHLHIAQSLCHQWLLPRLVEFKRLYPTVELKISTTSNPYPNSNQTADVEIINGVLPADSPDALRLTDEQWVVVASPNYLQQYPILELSDLALAEKLATAGYREHWAYWFDYCDYQDAVTKPSIQFDHSLLAIEAAILGLGVLLVKDMLVDGPLKRGELVRVGHWTMPSETQHYIVHHSRHNPHAVQFVDWILRSFRSSRIHPVACSMT